MIWLPFKITKPFKTIRFLSISNNRHFETVKMIRRINEFDRDFASKDLCVQSYTGLLVWSFVKIGF